MNDLLMIEYIKKEIYLLIGICNGRTFCERTANTFSWIMSELLRHEQSYDADVFKRIMDELNDISTINNLGKPMDEKIENRLKKVIEELESLKDTGEIKYAVQFDDNSLLQLGHSKHKYNFK